MKFNKDILIDKKRFKVPKGYFNTLINNSIEKNQLKSNRFKVPEKYFENLDKQEIFNRIYIDKIKALKINFFRVASIATMFTFVFYFSNYFENNSENISSDDIINYVNNDIIIMGNSEYIEILNSNDLNYNNLISEADIKNYFIESSLDLKNLIFE